MSSLGKTYWRSLEDLADTPEFRALVEREFPAFLDELASPASRRQFLEIMGASVAFAGMTACRWPAEEILPFASQPQGFVPGVAAQYATCFETAGAAMGLLVTSLDGRPIKIEGNPLHPQSLGATSAHAQASILDLYDPDRSRGLARLQGIAPSWDEFLEVAHPHFAGLRARGGQDLYFLSEASSSPSLADMRARLLQVFPRAVWLEWEPVSRDRARSGSVLAFGTPYRTHLRLDLAEAIVSLDEDFLLQHPSSVRYARDYAASRRVRDGRMSRLYVVESAFSLTGSNADHRLPIASQSIPAFAGCLAAELVLNLGLALPPAAGALLPALQSFQGHPLMSTHVWTMARELMVRRGRSLLLVGPRQPEEIHALAHVINLALGNVGTTLVHTPEPDPQRPTHVEAIRALAGAMGADRCDTLVVLGGNPAYDAPADLDFARKLASVRTSIHLGLYRNETSRACTWHVPRQHDLESWGDAVGWDGTYGIVQPLIEPLFGGKSPIELLAALTEDPASRGYDIVRRTFGARHGGADPEAAWRQALHDGVIAGSAWAPALPAPRAEGWAARLAEHAATRGNPAADELEVVFCPDPSVHDGRFANNGWLQELPDPLTKLTWDNAALIAPATAAALGVGTGDLLRIRHGRGELTLPAYLLPGQAAGSLTLNLGYGRRASGSVGDGVGFDAYILRTSEGMHRVTARVEKVPGRYPLATTQDHFAIDPLGAKEREDRSRTLVKELSLAQFQERAVAHPDRAHRDSPIPPGEGAGHASPAEEPPQLWKEYAYTGHKWGMAIDLNACVGCNACMVACQAENNVPVVGKDEVARGREMHWIRVDRYFQGDPANPKVVYQPVTCHHCENAPCEPVCPVAATLHDGEGLNVMVYNRCVGTRYCSNNCPYKVRRYNWFNNHKDESPLKQMIYNPDVTVRGRGVMEKCTFCTQRIESAKIKAKNERRPLRDGELVPACAQACCTRAIVFGDLNDEGSEVRRLQEDGRAYSMLGELNTRPRLRYLARLRNQVPDAAGGPRQG